MQTKCPQCGCDAEYIPEESTFCSECGAPLIPPAPAEVPVSHDDPAVPSGTPHDSPAVPPAVHDIPAPAPDVWDIPAPAPDVQDIIPSPAPANECGYSGLGNGFGGMTDTPGMSNKTNSINRKLDGIDDILDKHTSPLDDKPRPTPKPSVESSCAELDVDYNKNLFFLSGSESVIDFRLTPRTANLKNVLIFMEIPHNGKCTCYRIPVTEVLCLGERIEIKYSYRPENVSGSLVLTFYIGCRTDDSLKYYKYSVVHKVYDPTQSAASVAQHIVINAPTTIKASEAGEVNFKSNIEDAIRDLGPAPSLSSLIDRLNDLPPIYEIQKLTGTNWRPPDIIFVSPDLIYPAEKLLLEWNGYSMFVLGKESVVFGRDPDQVDLVVRSGGGKLPPTDYPNRTVSRKHATIQYRGDSVLLSDTSSYGTYINGRKPSSEGIPIGDKATVEFGDIHWQMNMQRCSCDFRLVECINCPAKTIKSVTFKRMDKEKECYLLVWQGCELGLVFPELADWTLFYRNGTYFIRTPRQKFFYLRPGYEIEANGQKIKVSYFQQN